VKHLDLFSGIGGFALAARRVGWETVGFCEIEPYAQKVLAKHWPDVPIYEDVRELTNERLETDGIGNIEIITGGFPCTDISVAGKQAGLGPETRSGLWSECARLTSELRPKYVIWENVSALLSGGDLVDTASGPVYRTWFGRILRDMAEIGYDCEWHCIPAGNPNGLSAGAPHRRNRVWIIAYPMRNTESNAGDPQRSFQEGEDPITGGIGGDVAYPGSMYAQGKQRERTDQEIRQEPGERPTGPQDSGTGRDRPTEPSLGLLAHGIATRLAGSRWLPEPGIGRVATGVPDRVNKLKALGNGLIWQIPYAIGCAIQDREFERELPWPGDPRFH